MDALRSPLIADSKIAPGGRDTLRLHLLGEALCEASEDPAVKEMSSQMNVIPQWCVAQKLSCQIIICF